ncbi:transposase [Novipirellula sp. SH528]|uniref:transposase n=1 Tax=Novipirellula sp. SH528 TaxID=3454466 RepID=UPI003FA018B9
MNLGNRRRTVFHKDVYYEVFENILSEGLRLYPCRILAYQLLPNHSHLVLQPSEHGGMSHFLRWVTLTHSMRYHAYSQTAGEGNVYQSRFKSIPVQDDDHFIVLCRYVERNAKRAGVIEKAEDWRWGVLYRWSQTSEPLPRLLSP